MITRLSLLALLGLSSLTAFAYESYEFMTEAPDYNFAPDRPKSYQVGWGAMTRPWTRNFVVEELMKPMPNSSTPLTGASVLSLPFSPLDGSTNDLRNPFQIFKGDFRTVMHLVPPPATPGPIPTVPENDAGWFKDVVNGGKTPDVFIIGGHHVVGSGFHNDPETMFMYSPTLVETVRTVPAAREYFDNVKFAILWGCNTLTNLEPHAEDGSYLPYDVVRSTYESGPQGKAAMIGAPSKINSLEFYKTRLAREYGPGMPKYLYTRKASAEKCKGTQLEPYKVCDVTNVERTLPDYGLWDGSLRYNQAARYKEVFRNAYLVLGYNSASPSEESRVVIFKNAVKNTYAALNKGLKPSDKEYVHNLIREIIDAETPTDRRVRIIEAFRAAWTKATYASNRNRPSGSITPALPELDKSGMFNVWVSNDTPLFAPYEQR